MPFPSRSAWLSLQEYALLLWSLSGSSRRFPGARPAQFLHAPPDLPWSCRTRVHYVGPPARLCRAVFFHSLRSHPRLSAHPSKWSHTKTGRKKLRLPEHEIEQISNKHLSYRVTSYPREPRLLVRQFCA